MRPSSRRIRARLCTGRFTKTIPGRTRRLNRLGSRGGARMSCRSSAATPGRRTCSSAWTCPASSSARLTDYSPDPYAYFSVEPQAFAAQFKGKSMRAPFRVGEDIHAVSRATITVASATRAVRDSVRTMAKLFLNPANVKMMQPARSLGVRRGSGRDLERHPRRRRHGT